MNKENFNHTPINWTAINSIALNDLVAYDSLLFTDEELQYDNCWEKYIVYNEKKGKKGKIIGVYMPFSCPQTVKEFALNHYVYWMVLYYTDATDKICLFYDYNTKQSMDHPAYYCWACAYDNLILKHVSENPNKIYSHTPCEFCPLWHGKLQCEDEGELYQQWTVGEGLETAKDIAEMTWTDFDYLLK